MINTSKIERNNHEFANIESLRGEPPPPPREIAINSTYEYERMERNNHTSAHIKSTGRRKFPPVNILETMKRLKVTINWKEIIVNLNQLKIPHDKYFENGKK